MNKKETNEPAYTAEVTDPTTDEKLSFVGVSQEEVEKQVADFFDFGLDSEGVYVGDSSE